jgi:hypothetical protein
VKRLRSLRVGEIPPQWVVLVGLVMLFAVAAVAFVDYEMTRADAVTARSNAEIARARCFSTSPTRIAERERRNARCERLIPVPERAADRVERRWDRRGPWYGLAAGAIFVLTALMFTLSRRRRASSAAVDASTSALWRVVTIAVEVTVGILVWSALYHLADDRWNSFVKRLEVRFTTATIPRSTAAFSASSRLLIGSSCPGCSVSEQRFPLS